MVYTGKKIFHPGQQEIFFQFCHKEVKLFMNIYGHIFIIERLISSDSIPPHCVIVTARNFF